MPRPVSDCFSPSRDQPLCGWSSSSSRYTRSASAKRFADAERVYREEIADHPHNGWSLFGLQQAIAGQGKRDDAVTKDMNESWARADAWIRASRY